MPRTNIEWVRNPETGKAGYSLNPIKGLCKHGCPYCYAIKMYKRFKWDTEVRLDLSVFDECRNMEADSKVFICSTHDLCGSWISDDWIDKILQKIREYPNLIFVLLTKVPGRFWGASLPSNVWLGTTVESQKQAGRIETLLLVDAKLRFVSFEPLQGKIDYNFVNHETEQKISWFICGKETGNRKEKIIPKKEWITHLLTQRADTPAFLKNNLRPCFDGDLVQRLPEVKK